MPTKRRRRREQKYNYASVSLSMSRKHTTQPTEIRKQQKRGGHVIEWHLAQGCPIKGILSQIRTKLRDWAVWQARAGCYSQAALSSNDSKTLYTAVQ